MLEQDFETCLTNWFNQFLSQALSKIIIGRIFQAIGWT